MSDFTLCSKIDLNPTIYVCNSEDIRQLTQEEKRTIGDTYLDVENDNENYGSEDKLLVGDDNNYHCLFLFDVSNVTSGESATLRVVVKEVFDEEHVTAGFAEDGIDVFWDEDDLTHDNKPTSLNLFTTGDPQLIDEEEAIHTWDMDEYIDDIIDADYVTMGLTEHSTLTGVFCSFWSKEGSLSKMPKLIIE